MGEAEREAAVLAVLNNQQKVLICRRSLTLRKHPGEVCLPGGMREDRDLSLQDTALRETAEVLRVADTEVGLDATLITMNSKMRPLLSLAGFLVHAFIAECASGDPDLKLNSDETLGRSRTVITNYLADPLGYGSKTSGGRPRKLTEREERQIARKASNSTASVMDIKAELNLNVSRRTIQRAIRRNPHITRQKMTKIPNLTTVHHQQRTDFAKNNMARDWTKVDAVTWIPLEKFLEKEHHSFYTIREFTVHSFQFPEYPNFTVFGLTAMILIIVAMKTFNRHPEYDLNPLLSVEKYPQYSPEQLIDRFYEVYYESRNVANKL